MICVLRTTALDKERLGAFVRYLDTAAHSIRSDHHIANEDTARKMSGLAGRQPTCEVVYGFLER